MSRMDLERVALAHLEDNTEELALEIVGEELEEQGEPEQVLEQSEDRLSQKGQNSVKNMVKRSIENQFGSNYAFLRELVQNGRDAYRAEEGKARVEIDYESGGNERSVTARDYGEGMSPEDVVSKLLVPMESDKVEDLDSIGEHGVGWFSTLDAGDAVRVTTGDQEEDLKSTVWIAEDSEGQRKVNLNVSDDGFEGTEVEVLDLGRSPLDKNLSEDVVRGKLETLVGHANPEDVEFLFNGQKLNKKAAEFSRGGVGTTDEGSATLYFSRTEEEDLSSSVVTQGGLKVKELGLSDYSGLPEIKQDILRNLDRNFGLWIDYSNDFSLDKGRTDFAAEDRDAAEAALEDAVDQFYMERVLDDEDLLRDLDLDVTDELEQMFTDVFEQINNNGEERGGEMDSYGDDEFTPSWEQNGPLFQELRTVGVKHWLKDRIPARFKDEDVDVEEILRQIERRKANGVRFDKENFKYKKKIFTEKCIPAERDGEPSQVSLGEVLKLYSEEGADRESGEVILGDIKVSEGHPLASKAFEKINDLEKEREHYQFLSGLKEESEELYRTFSEFLFGAEEGVDFVIERTSYDTLEETVGEQNEGEAYLDFLHISNYINDFMEDALDLQGDSEVMLHYDPKDEYTNNRHLAHTNNQDISFNLAGSADGLVREMEEGFDEEEEYRRFIEKVEHVIYHERSHIEHEDEGKAAHGESFWNTKEDLRKNVREYAIRNGRDIHAEIAEQTNLFEGYDHMDARELGEQIERQKQGITGYLRSKAPI